MSSPFVKAKFTRAYECPFEFYRYALLEEREDVVDSSSLFFRPKCPGVSLLPTKR